LTTHVRDHYLLEVIDPATGQVREPGEPGELVFTTLSREATPLLRWRTRDVVAESPRPQSRGGTHRCGRRRVCGRGRGRRRMADEGRSSDACAAAGA